MKSFLRSVALLLALTAQITLAQVIVPMAPPPPPRGAGIPIGRPPRPGFVWTPGYQRWDSGRYMWVPGRWARPPRPGAVWVPDTWRRRRNGWVLRRGYWR